MNERDETKQRDRMGGRERERDGLITLFFKSTVSMIRRYKKTYFLREYCKGSRTGVTSNLIRCCLDVTGRYDEDVETTFRVGRYPTRFFTNTIKSHNESRIKSSREGQLNPRRKSSRQTPVWIVILDFSHIADSLFNVSRC